MKRKWLYVAAPVAIVALIFIGGEVVQQLWNWLGPELFGLRLITFWQALGLLALCRILFGGSGMRGGKGRSAWKRGPEGWRRLTPEEREQFREYLRSRARGDEPPTAPAM